MGFFYSSPYALFTPPYMPDVKNSVFFINKTISILTFVEMIFLRLYNDTKLTNKCCFYMSINIKEEVRWHRKINLQTPTRAWNMPQK